MKFKAFSKTTPEEDTKYLCLSGITTAHIRENKTGTIMLGNLGLIPFYSNNFKLLP